MAKKPASSRARTAKAARKASPKKPAAKKAAKSAAKKPAKKPAKSTTRPAAKKTAKAAAKRPAKKAAKKAPARVAAKPKAPAKKAASRTIVARRQPESLRLRATTPGLTVNDVQASLAFYVDGLGFIVKQRWEREGQLLGAMLVAGRCELAVGQDDWAKGRDRVKGVGFRIYAETTQSLDALAERLRARGIAAEGPLDTSWGARVVNVTDPDGFNLTLSNDLT
jgi:uncharacterized glyoxalase superfamily protein PhnB